MELLKKNITNFINVIFVFAWMLFIPKGLSLFGVDHSFGLLIAVIAYVIVGIEISKKITDFAIKQ